MSAGAAAAYVALGDSYAAGVGGGPRRGPCWRATQGYPVAVARSLGLDVAYEACIAATVADVERSQLGALGEATTHVSVTVGGNDAGFVPVLIAAAAPAWFGDSDIVLDAGLRVVRERLPRRLDRLFAGVRRRAPRAVVVATDYPVLLRGADCNLATFFSASEVRRLADAVVELSGVIRAAASRAGVGFVGVRPDFAGHEVCAPQEWLNGVALPVEASFHPNRRGHTAYGREVSGALAGAGATGPQGVGPEGVGEPAGREPVVVPGPAVRGSAPTFRLPDLLSEASLRGAAQHGLDPEEVRRLALAVQTPGLSARGGHVGVVPPPRAGRRGAGADRPGLTLVAGRWGEAITSTGGRVRRVEVMRYLVGGGDHLDRGEGAPGRGDALPRGGRRSPRPRGGCAGSR